MARRLRHVQAPERRGLTGMLATTARAAPGENKNHEQDEKPNEPACNELFAQGEVFARAGVRTKPRNVGLCEEEQVKPKRPRRAFLWAMSHGSEGKREAANRCDNGQQNVTREKAPIHWLLTNSVYPPKRTRLLRAVHHIGG